MSKHYYKPFVAVYLILLKNNKILLLKRKNTGYGDNNFSLPAGHLENNETVAEALVREVKEEIGIKVRVEDLLFNQVIHYKSVLGKRKYLDFFFVTKTFQGKPKNIEPNKCGQIKWFPIGKLPNNLVLEVREALNNFKKKRVYSELNWKK